MPFDALIKFRCEQSLEDRLARIASHPRVRRDVPDLLRLALEDYASAQEQALGISADVLRDAPRSPAATAAAITQHAVAAANAGGTGVSYSAAKPARKRAKKPQSPQS
jgi:hypothetical protein